MHTAPNRPKIPPGKKPSTKIKRYPKKMVINTDSIIWFWKQLTHSH